MPQNIPLTPQRIEQKQSSSVWVDFHFLGIGSNLTELEFHDVDVPLLEEGAIMGGAPAIRA